VADIIAIENTGMHTHGPELMIHEIGNRALAAGAQAGEPDNAPRMAVELFTLSPRNRVFVPMDLDFRHNKTLPRGKN
jgi:hypothetical protein